jgi:hypothetical protein
MLMQYGPGGPVAAATNWLGAVYRENDLRAAWRLTDPDLRLVLAQAWLWANRQRTILANAEPDDLKAEAAELARVNSSSPYWRAFSETQLLEFRQLEFDFDTWGFASAPRLIAPDYELLLLTECGADGVLMAEPTQVLAHRYLMHHTTEGWLVAGFGPAPISPGWPPVRPPEWDEQQSPDI